MPQTVSVPDFGEIEFPDEMSPGDIEKNIRTEVYGLAELPAPVADDDRTFIDRRNVAKSNLGFAASDLIQAGEQFERMAADVKAGKADISEEDLQAANRHFRVQHERAKIAEKEFAQVQKDDSPFWESTKAAGWKSVFQTAAAGGRLLSPISPSEHLKGLKAGIDHFQKMVAQGEAKEKAGTLGFFERQDLDNDRRHLSEQTAEYNRRLFEDKTLQKQWEENPAVVFTKDASRAADDMFTNFAASEFSENPRAKMGRAIGHFVPAAAVATLSLPASVAQMASSSYEGAYMAARNKALSENKTEEEADELAQQAGSEAAVTAAAQLGPYMAVGKLTTGVVARLFPKTSPIGRAAWGALGATGMNVATSGAFRKFSGGKFLPDLEQLTGDVSWALLHGKDEYSGAKQARSILSGDHPAVVARMNAAVDEAPAKFAAALETQGKAALSDAQARAQRFPDGSPGRKAAEEEAAEAQKQIEQAGEIKKKAKEDQRSALAQIDDMITQSRKFLGQSPEDKKLKAAAPKVGPATEAAVADLVGEGAPKPAAEKPVVNDAIDAPKGKTGPDGEIVYSEMDTAGGTPGTGERESGAVEAKPAPSYNSELRTVDIPLDRLSLSTDVPQFKGAADPVTGIVEPLQGKFDRRGVTPIQVWERLNGKLEVISGRHRFDLAKRSGEPDIPAQVYREADGFTKQEAAMLDAELNIRDENGSVSDFANYFRNSGVSQADAQARGILGGAKGRQGFSIGTRASEDIFALHQAGKLTDAKAAAIVNAAPGDANLQRLALKYANAHPTASAGEIGHYLNATAAFQKLGEFSVDSQGDLFGTSDASINAADKAASVAKELEGNAREDVRILTTALNRAGQLKLTEAEAKRFGVNRDDAGGIKKALDAAKVRAEGWDAWHLDEAKKAAVFALAGVHTPAAKETGQGEAPARAATPKEDLFAGRQDDIFNLTAESAKDRAAREARERQEQIDKETAQREADKAESEKAQAGLFDAPTPVEPPKPAPKPPVAAKPAEKPAAKPKAEPAAGQGKQRVRLRGSSPQTYTVEGQLARQKGDLPDETYFTVRNERTGETQTVEARDLRPVGKKGEDGVKLEAVAEKVIENMPDKPEVALFENAGDIPAELGADAPNVKKAIADGNILEGWHAPLPDGRRVLVLNKDGIAKVAEQMGISVEERTAQVTRHELGHDRQHIGALLPAADRRAYDSVVGGVLSRDNATAAEIADLYGYDLKTREGRAKTAEEILVREGEKPKPAAWYHRAMAALLDIFRSIGYKGKLTESELRTMLDYANRGRADARKRAHSGDYALSQQRAQVGGEKGVGHEYDTRDIATTRATVRESTFDASQPTTPAHTAKAWKLIEDLTDLQSGRAHETAGDIVDRTGGSDIAVPLAKVELMNYAARLAGEGDPSMMNHLLGTVNLMPNSMHGTGESASGAVLRARQELESGMWKAVIGQANANDAATATMLAGRSPTSADLNFVRQLKAELAAEKAKPLEPGEKLPAPPGTDLDKIAEAIRGNPMLQAMVQIARNGYENGRQFTFTASNEPVATASQERKAAVGKLLQGGDKLRQQLENYGADALEGSFWKSIDAPKEEGPLNEIDKAQNQQLAGIVKDTLSKMGIEAPPGSKMTDAEKVAAMLNKRPLDQAKMKLADEKIRAEIEQRRERDLKTATDDAERMGIDAYYSNLRDAWDAANKRATAIPISDALMRRLVNTELKSKENPAGLDMAETVKASDPRVREQSRKAVVDKAVAKVDAASWPGRDYSTLRTWLESTFDRMYDTRRAKREAARAREEARRAAGVKPDDAANFMIQSFARSQSDTPAFPTPKVENAVRRIVREAIREHGPQNERNAWLADMKGRLMSAGVAEPIAESLSARVLREREIRETNKLVSAQDRAAESGSLAPIIDAINATPLANRTGDWITRTIHDYLKNSKLSDDQARGAAQLFGNAIKARMEEAQVKAFEKSVKESDTYKASVAKDPRKAKSDLDKLIGAVRSGAADPSNTFTSKIAALNGWKGFSPADYTRLAQLDAIYTDPQTLPYKRTQAATDMLNIAAKTGAPPAFLKSLNEYYTANALSGIPTDAINVASPGIFLLRDAITDATTGLWKGPQHVESVAKSLMSALDGYVGELAFAGKSDSYGHHANEWFDHQPALKRKLDDGLARLKSGKGIVEKAAAVKDVFLGLHDYVRRALSTLDQGAISVLENYNLSRYAMAELRRRGLGSGEINRVLESVIEAKSRFFADARAKGMGWAEAKTAANDFTRDAWVKALDAQGVKGQDVSSAAINDALRAVGRVGKDSEGNRLRDVGMLSSPMMALIDAMSGIAKSKPGVGLLYKSLFGFFATAARTVHGAAWYSPYGFIRLAADRAFKKAGQESPYAQTLATDQQGRQRLRDAFAGTLVMAALSPLLTSSADDEDKPFKVTVTGNGPASDDPSVRDAWLKQHKPYSLEVTVGGKTMSVNLGRSGEAVMPALVVAGAHDDLALRRKHEKGKAKPADIDTTMAVGSSLWYQFANRGPYSALAKVGRMFPDKANPNAVANVAGEAAYSAKPLIPILGSALAKNISDLMSGPLDKSTVTAAITANLPFVGPAVNEPALNRLGDPIGDQGFDAKLWRLGVPAVVSLPDESPDRLAYDLIKRQGQGPPSMTRADIESRYEQPLTDRQWRQFVQVQGHELKSLMVENYDKLLELDPDAFNKQLNKWAAKAEAMAAKELDL